MTEHGLYRFSNVYVEEAAYTLPQTSEIIDRLNNPRIIMIHHHGDVFNRPRQNFKAQKHDPALIIACERETFLYAGNERINSWTQGRLFYNALIRNCLYNCEYCFLQGMHASAHTLMFVNNDDFINAAHCQSQKGPMYLSISYLSDLLAFEPLYPYCTQWIDFASSHPEVSLEIRTKSDYYRAVSHLKPLRNVFFVWSLSPDTVSRGYERGCASFQNRLFAAAQAAMDGWPLKLSFDPVLYVKGWEKIYPAMLRETFNRIPAESVHGVSFGLFRMNSDYFKRIRGMHDNSPLFHHGINIQGSLASYSADIFSAIHRMMENELSKYIDPKKIFFVHG